MFFSNEMTYQKFCFLAAQVKPSHDNSFVYETWLCLISRDYEAGYGGGDVWDAYCTCLIGLLGDCNQVSALLFKVEHMIKQNDPVTFTSRACTWDHPGPPQKKDIVKMKVGLLMCEIW